MFGGRHSDRTGWSSKLAEIVRLKAGWSVHTPGDAYHCRDFNSISCCGAT